MNGRRRPQLPPAFDYGGTLHVLRSNIARADAFITAAERIVDEPLGVAQEAWDEDEAGDSPIRRRNHLAHLIESAKLAVRGAIYAGNEIDVHRPK